MTTDGKESKLVKDILGRQAEQEAASKTKDDEVRKLLLSEYQSVILITFCDRLLMTRTRAKLVLELS